MAQLSVAEQKRRSAQIEAAMAAASKKKKESKRDVISTELAKKYYGKKAAEAQAGAKTQIAARKVREAYTEQKKETGEAPKTIEEYEARGVTVKELKEVGMIKEVPVVKKESPKIPFQFTKKIEEAPETYRGQETIRGLQPDTTYTKKQTSVLVTMKSKEEREAEAEKARLEAPYGAKEFFSPSTLTPETFTTKFGPVVGPTVRGVTTIGEIFGGTLLTATTEPSAFIPGEESQIDLSKTTGQEMLRKGIEFTVRDPGKVAGTFVAETALFAAGGIIGKKVISKVPVPKMKTTVVPKYPELGYARSKIKFADTIEPKGKRVYLYGKGRKETIGKVPEKGTKRYYMETLSYFAEEKKGRVTGWLPKDVYKKAQKTTPEFEVIWEKPKPKYEVTYWRGAAKSEFFEVFPEEKLPIKMDWVVEKSFEPKVSTRVIPYEELKTTVRDIDRVVGMKEMSKVKRPTSYLERGTLRQDVFKKVETKKPPEPPELVDVIEIKRGKIFEGFGPEGKYKAKYTYKETIPFTFKQEKPFKVTKWTGGKPRKGDILREMYPYKEPVPEAPKPPFPGKLEDFYADLLKPKKIKRGGKPPEMKVLTDVGLRPVSKAKGKGVPISVTEVGTRGFGLFDFGAAATVSLTKPKAEYTPRIDEKRMMGFRPKETFREREMLGEKEKLKEQPIEITTTIPEFDTVIKTDVRTAQKEREKFRQKQVQIRRKTTGTPSFGFGVPGSPTPIKPIEPIVPTFEDEREREYKRGKKKKKGKRKYQYAPSLGGILGIIPAVGKEPKTLTGLGMRPVVIKRR